MKLLEYIEIQTWDVNPDNTTGFGDGVAFYPTYVLPENKEKYETLYPNHQYNKEVNSSDIEWFDECEWMTHPEEFYQITVEDYKFEQYSKEQGFI